MVHIGPSDYVPSLEDQKIAYIRVSGSGFCGVPLDIDVKLEVQDSPNSAAVVVDVILYSAAARDKGVVGVVDPICSYYMKYPPRPLKDETAVKELRVIAAKSG